MTTKIGVDKQSVIDLLSKGQERSFLIPDYQRPYTWTEDEVITLFDDIWNFTENQGGSDHEDAYYFLGSIVWFENDEKKKEIIDGQQRITSLLLLLRAIYTKLDTLEKKNDEALNFLSKIEPALWKADKLTGKVKDKSQILLESRVITKDANSVFHNIIETGEANPDAKDNYSKNYLCFQKLFDDSSTKNALMIYDFIYALLYQAILLPITADSQETALTIFSTLNDRGLPLSDADIFKAKMYNFCNKECKEKFIEDWKNLEEEAEKANESIQKLFYYYMFYVRAVENDKNTTTPGVRAYFSKNKYKSLEKVDDVLNMLSTILNLWKVINVNVILEDESWSKNKKIKQLLDVLKSYSNEIWKYPVIIYYVKYKDTINFDKNFEIFLKKLLSNILIKYLITSNINETKTDILYLNLEIIKSDKPIFNFSNNCSDERIKSNLIIPKEKVIKMILKILAYQCQEELLPEKWQIEHILPRKWQDNYFLNNTGDEIREMIDHIGNKLPFEDRLNISAGNGYFGKKKEKYRNSKIKITNVFGNSDLEDWNLGNIKTRDEEIFSQIMQILSEWDKQ